MRRIHAVICLFFLFVISATAQPKCFFEHYGVEDGLPQNSIMDIMQDKKDFMWFSTWNGLSKFDGHNFYAYKIQQEEKRVMRSNRIDMLREDIYGYIWTLPYDREPLRFDPRTEKFVGLKSFEEYKNFTFIATNIITAGSGKVWLLSDNMGCVCVMDSTFKVKTFNSENGKIHGNKVNTVYEDKDLNSWILTDNGLYLFSKDGKISDLFSEREGFIRNSAQGFYSVMELDDQIWFSSDNGRIWIYNKKDEQFTLLEAKTSSPIPNLKNINGNQLLITTRDDGFFIYHLSTGQFDKYDTNTLRGMRSDEIMSCYVDKSKNIWLELNCLGVSKFNVDTKTIKHFEMEIESTILNVFPPNFYIFEDKENRLWVHPRGGGFAIFDPGQDKLIPFYNELSSPSWRFSNVVQVAFSDRQGNLWMSTRSHGIEKIIFNNDVFNSTIVDNNVNSTINNDIRSMYEDADQNLWMSTKGEKIYVYDSERNKLGYVSRSGKIDYDDTPINGICYCIMQDDKKNIWIGTKGEGIYRLTPTADPKQFSIKQYKNSPNNLYSLSNDNVYSIYQDAKGRMWVGTYGGGLNLLEDEEEGRFINYRNNLKNYPMLYGSQIRMISSDKYGNICLGTTLGLIIFQSDFQSVNNIQYTSYNKIEGDDNSLSGNDVYDICTTRSGDTYLATFGGGVNRIVEVDENGFPVRFVSYGIRDGLPSDVILMMVEDEKENLWIATEGNLTKFGPVKNAFETYSEVSRLIKGQSFSENSRCLSRSGNILFGFSKGFISVDPSRINTNDFKPYVALTKLQIANKDVEIGEDSPLKQNLDYTDRIRLDHTQNFINIEFVALDYIESKRILYAYKLEGFDKDWIVTQKQRIANYSNLSAGEYVFRVRSTNSDGIWMDNEHMLHIEILPSFWQTGWAYMLYILLLVIAVYVILRLFFSFYRLENKVKLEHEQTEMKTRFFTDISHEIRTPLTMIVSPVENILEDKRIPDDVNSQLQLVLKNANRMLRMVNQILDFRKIQKKALAVQETTVAPLVSEVCDSFSKTAEESNVHLIFNNQVGDERLWVDRDSFEKLLFNLLSNAFKYTQSGRTIEVSLTQEKKDNVILLLVRDEGRGMSKEILNKLFTRFASFNKDKNKPSTGIGLSIVKEVADKHHAKIEVESEVNKGSSFMIYFLKGMEHFREDEGVTFVYGESVVKEAMEEEEEKPVSLPVEKSRSLTKSNKQTILVVEDDADLRRFIMTILEPYYTLLEAADGKQGYETAVGKMPDFIVSDIMMPEIDGVELLQKIRSNPNTSHIPFILLTAKSNLESVLSGLEYGADDYITKPFSVKYLRARIDNIILQRQRLYKLYTSKGVFATLKNQEEPAQDHKITQQDELFLQRVKEEIEKNIDDSEFLVDDLVSNLAMSRTVFFKKLKSLTGLAPIEFIRDIKIKHAAKLIETQEYTIKEVSFLIGISDTKYFTRCFKSIFGMTPSEYKNMKKKV